MKWNKWIIPCLLSLLLVIAVTDNVLAECVDKDRYGEIGILGGYGYNFPVSIDLFRGKNVNDDVRFLFLIPYIGTSLKDWGGCRGLQFNLEGFLSYAVQEGDKDRYAIGITPFFQFNLGGINKVIPFIGIGSGILYTDLNPEGLGSHFNFTPQIGIGIRYKVDEKRYLVLSYRYHHISNAGTKSPNESIDSNFFIIGITIH